MDFAIDKVSGIGDYESEVQEISREGESVKTRTVYKKPGDDKVFLVVNQNTIEVRTDAKLSSLLREKYESVMQSRYFGKGGVEIVLAGQLDESELEDMVRLSYNLS